MSQIEIILTLQPKQREALEKSEITPVLFYGGSKGSGKSYLVRAREVKRRLLYRGTKGLIVRKTYPELLANHIRPFFKEYPITRKWYNKAEKTIYWPNGSTTEFSYLGNTDDVYTYQGREYDDEAIDEVTQHEWEVVRILRSSLRTINPQIKPTMLLTGNPGGIGHQEVKRIFVDRNFREDEKPSDYAFVQAFVQDNNALMDADPEYVKRLEDLPEHLRRAYLLGDWNIFAGVAFTELERKLHIIDPIELPQSTKYYASFDPGYNHPFSFIIYAIVPEGTVYVIKHYTNRLQTTRDISQSIREYADGKELIIYSGHDLWYPGRGGGPSQHEEFLENGIDGEHGFNWIKAKTDHKSGVRQIHKYINPKNYPDGKPRVFFFRNCTDVYDAVAQMQIDTKNPEDVVKMDADDNGYGGDDVFDSFRYGLMSRVQPNDLPAQKPAQFSGQSILNQLLEEQY
jgi:phage terminase large subunit